MSEASEPLAATPAEGAHADVPELPVLEDDTAAEPRRSDWFGDGAVLAVCLLVLIAAALLSVKPGNDGVTVMGVELPETCGLKRMSGLDCPGCGLTRSFTYGIKLDPHSFQLHPMGPLLLLLTVLQLPYRSWKIVHRRRLARAGQPPPRTSERASWYWARFRDVLVGSMLAIWVVKISMGLNTP